jgi:hypothetical protein
MDTAGLSGGFGFLQAGFILGHAPVDFLDCMLAGVAILFLKQTSQDIELSGGPFQIVIGEFAPPRLGLAPDLFPFTFEYIFVHGSSFMDRLKKLPVIAASSNTDACGHGTQALGHALGRFTLADKCIRTRRERSLLTGIQMADQDDNQRGGAGSPEFIQG